jgi:hypothetical protein
MRAKTVHDSMYLDVYHWAPTKESYDLIKKQGFKFNNTGIGLIGKGFYSLYKGEYFGKHKIKYSIPLEELKKGFIINDDELIFKIWGYAKPQQLIHDELFFPELIKEKGYPFDIYVEPPILKSIPIVKNQGEFEIEIRKIKNMSFSDAWIFQRCLIHKNSDFINTSSKKVQEVYEEVYEETFIQNGEWKLEPGAPEWDILNDFENDKTKFDKKLNKKLVNTNAYKQLTKNGHDLTKFNYSPQHSSHDIEKDISQLDEHVSKSLGLRGFIGNFVSHEYLFYTNDKSLLKDPKFYN